MMDEVNEGCGQLGLEESSLSLVRLVGECGKFESSPEILRKGRHYRRMSCSPLELGLGDFSQEGRCWGGAVGRIDSFGVKSQEYMTRGERKAGRPVRD